jgi:hypothetical protein
LRWGWRKLALPSNVLLAGRPAALSRPSVSTRTGLVWLSACLRRLAAPRPRRLLLCDPGFSDRLDKVCASLLSSPYREQLPLTYQRDQPAQRRPDADFLFASSRHSLHSTGPPTHTLSLAEPLPSLLSLVVASDSRPAALSSAREKGGLGRRMRMEVSWGRLGGCEDRLFRHRPKELSTAILVVPSEPMFALMRRDSPQTENVHKPPIVGI